MSGIPASSSWRTRSGHGRWDEAVLARPELRLWLDELRRQGLLSRAAAGGITKERLLRDALAVARRCCWWTCCSRCIRRHGRSARAGSGQAPYGAGRRAAACLAGWEDVPPSAIARRLLWAEVGRALRPALERRAFAGPASGGRGAPAPTPEGRGGRRGAAGADPARAGSRTPLSLAPSDLYVCENPSATAAGAARRPPGAARVHGRDALDGGGAAAENAPWQAPFPRRL